MLKDYLGADCEKPVYAFQQTYIDVTQSIFDRICLLDNLGRNYKEEIFPFFLWIDTDRAGADKIISRIYWPLFKNIQSIPICPNAMKDIEIRFVDLDPLHLENAIEKVGTYLVQSVNGTRKRKDALERYREFKGRWATKEKQVMSQFNHRVISYVLEVCANLSPVPLFVSHLIEDDRFIKEIEEVLSNIEAVIREINQAISRLQEMGIDPVMKPLSEDYLPLNYSCPGCLRRIRLRQILKKGECYAGAKCRCGQAYRFSIGRKSNSIASLVETKRWSPDVSLAMVMNNFVSGFIAGQSSGVYFGLLMKNALEKVMARARVPVLLSIPNMQEQNKQDQGLIYRYLTTSMA
jgi:hypothetical protein